MSSKSAFRENLCQIASVRLLPTDLEKLSDDLMRSFLDFGFETPDNLNCYDHIEVGWIHDRQFGPRSVYGLKLRDETVLVSDIIHLIEDMDLPDSVKDYYPELTENQWSAILRMATMVLLALERRTAPSE